MRNTTLCYIENNGSYLMLHRVKKAVDENKNKWIGVGGKFEEGESPEECLIREVREETGLQLNSYRFRGIVTFVSNDWGTEYMHLFTSDSFTGTVGTCSEGELAWIDRNAVETLNIWEGDRVFLRLLLADEPFFLLKLCYDGDRLVSAILNGSKIDIS